MIREKLTSDKLFERMQILLERSAHFVTDGLSNSVNRYIWFGHRCGIVFLVVKNEKGACNYAKLYYNPRRH